MDSNEGTLARTDTEQSTHIPGSFSPAFVALLQHIGRIIAKDMIEKSKAPPAEGDLEGSEISV